MKAKIFITTFCALGLCANMTANAAELSKSQTTNLLSTKVGESISVVLPAGENGEDIEVRFKRIDVYAPNARLIVIGDKGESEISKSTWHHFLSDKFAPNPVRASLSISEDGAELDGFLFDPSGQTFSLRANSNQAGLKITREKIKQTHPGENFHCGNATHDTFATTPKSLLAVSQLEAALQKEFRVPTGGSRFAQLAFDTDNQFMNLKFSNNTTNATNYIAALVAAMNVIYERDFDLTLTIGTTILRPSTTADPYTLDEGGNNFATPDQLDEFGVFWAANQSTTSRAFALMLSGKQINNMGSSGIANVPFNNNPLNINYCNNRAGTSGSYSFTQVFKFAGSTGSTDASVIAHELGHNFGAFHTHCANATTGIGPASSSTIDQCESGESAFGCFSGAETCPALSTVNGVTNVRGTIMSYCHISGPSPCNSNSALSNVFATAQRTYIGGNVTNNVTAGCFTGVSTPIIFLNGFE